MVTINVSSTATDTALVSLPVVFSPVTAVSLTTINLGVDVLTNVNYALSFFLFFCFGGTLIDVESCSRLLPVPSLLWIVFNWQAKVRQLTFIFGLITRQNGTVKSISTSFKWAIINF